MNCESNSISEASKPQPCSGTENGISSLQSEPQPLPPPDEQDSQVSASNTSPVPPLVDSKEQNLEIQPQSLLPTISGSVPAPSESQQSCQPPPLPPGQRDSEISSGDDPPIAPPGDSTAQSSISPPQSTGSCVAAPPPPPPPPPPPLGAPFPGYAPPPPPLPPPLPGCIPPPPPLPGCIPPPPPLPGCIPPPPPLPGCIPPPPPPPPLPGAVPPPPPPPPPLSGFGPPPPPPIPGSGPPPPPPIPGAMNATSMSSGGTCHGIVNSVGPAPLPAPPVGGWSTVYHRARKTPVTPKAPMKPLYWTRIQVLTPAEEIAQREKENENTLWEKLEDEHPENLEEFVNLFSRQVVKPKKDSKPKESSNGSRSKIAQKANILDCKRAHTVNIFITSLRLEISEIENAVYNFDTSVVGTETLQKIFEIYATNDELSQIKAHLKSNPNIPLGKPEQFLYDLSLIPFFADRVACIMFEIQFSETLSSIETRLNNFKVICDTLVNGKGIKDVFSIILALGNYMNGGNRDRGQADGFGLEILPKLKDVKSSIDASVTLLHYVVKVYIDKHVSIDDVTRDVNNAKLPVPEPQNLERASLVVFDDISSELKRLLSQTKGIELKVNRVLESCTQESDQNAHIEPFKSRMQRFIEKAYQSLKEEEDNLSVCMKRFPDTIKFFKWRPKSSNQADACKEFFAIWLPFSSDFKDIFMKEIHRRIKLDVEKAKEKVKEQKSKKIPETTKKSEPGGLKSKLKKKGLIHKNT